MSLNVRNTNNMMPSMHANHKINIYAPITIANCLPMPIRIDTDPINAALERVGSAAPASAAYVKSIAAGQILNVHMSLTHLRLVKIHVTNYLGTNWMGLLDLTRLVPKKQQQQEAQRANGNGNGNGAAADREAFRLEMRVSPTNEMHIADKRLSIYVSFKQPNEFVLYSPYWLINKSGHHVRISSDHRIFDLSDETTLLFDYRNESKNNRVQMSVKNSRWTNQFSLETAGTTGMIQCKDDTTHYTYNVS